MTTIGRAGSDRSAIARSAGAAALILAVALAGCATGRASAAEADRIAEVLHLKPGMRVADVGAGDGEWTVELARRVGEGGHVYATEVDEDDLEDLRELVEDEELAHVTTLLGDQEDTGLPEGCCDAILLRLVYHHFTDPPPMRGSLWRALRPGGRIAVIDLQPQTSWRELPGVPDRGGHGILAEDVVAEMTADGFEVVALDDDWPGDEEHYCLVFRRPEAAEQDGTGLKP